MKVQRVEKQMVKPTNEYFPMLDHFCFLSKNLYNHANYIVRQSFLKDNKWVRYGELDKQLKADQDYPDYAEMPTAQAAQQTLRLLDKNWKSFFASIKDWSKNKDKYLGKPKLPRYANKNGKKALIITNQNCKLKDGMIHFPKSFNGFVCKFYCCNRPDFVKLNQVRFLPHYNCIVIEIVYEVEITDTVKQNQNYISIDIGVDNLVTVTNSFGKRPFIINGKPMKSVNQYYNKQVSKYRSIAKQMNGVDYTKRIDILTEKRNRKIEDYLHKTSREIIKYCKKYNVSKIIIGKNKEWKQNSKLSKKENQHFVQIPYNRLIQMLEYKAQEIGVTVIIIEESYTSGTSFVDNEMPVKENYNKSRRIKRGLFKTSDGSFINADVNGSYQIMKKVIPNGEILWNRGCAYQPFRVAIA